MKSTKCLLGFLLFATAIFAVAALSVESVEHVADIANLVDLDCPQICPALYAPVCATVDDKQFEEFDNHCLLKVANCRRANKAAVQPFVVRDRHWCTSEYVVNLFETLSNLDLQKPECLNPCPMIYSPVCVSNGKYRATLSNSCLLDAVNCALNNTVSEAFFRVLRHDQC